MSEEVKLNVASQESVALQLANDIASREKLYEDDTTYRKKLLDLYAECLQATRNAR